MSALLAFALAAAASAAPGAWTVSGASTAVLGADAVLVYRPAAPVAGALKPDALASGTTDFVVTQAAARPDGSWAWTVLPMNVGALDFTARWTLDGRALAAPTVRLSVTAPKIAKDADIADIKAPRAAPWPWWPWLVAAALAAAAYAAWKARKNRAIDAPSVIVAPPVPPETAAENAIAELEASGLWERGEHATFYLRLTDILRAYLEARYGEAATAMTSAEVARLVKSREPDLRASATAREVLSRADLVKFARIKPSASEGPDDVGLVRALISATTPKDAARAVAATAEAAR